MAVSVAAWGVAEWAAVAGTAVSAIGAVGQHAGQQKSAKYQKRGLNIQRQQQAEEVRRQRIESRRRARIAAAQITASGEAAGGAGGSAVAGGVASVGSREAGQENQLTSQLTSTNAFITAQQSSVKAQEAANMWATVGALGNAAGATFGSFTKPANLKSTKTT
jgi:hypothetical protein